MFITSGLAPAPGILNTLGIHVSPVTGMFIVAFLAAVIAVYTIAFCLIAGRDAMEEHNEQ